MAIQNQGWAYVSGSNTATPGGANTQVQYNDDGSLQGSSKFTFDGADVTVIGDITGSAFSGDGSGLTNISSDDVDTTTDTTNATRYIPFVVNATSTDGEILLIDDAISINPSTGVFTAAGGIVAGGSLTDGTATISAGSVSGVTTINASGLVTGGSLTDGTATISAGAASGFTTINASGLVTGGSLTDGAATISAGALTGVTTINASGDITGTRLVLSAGISGGTSFSGSTSVSAATFHGDGSALTNLPGGGGGGGGLLTAINGTQAYLTSSLAIGGSSAPDHTLSISGSVSGSGILRAASFAADGAAVLGGSLTAAGVVAGGAISSATSIDGSGDLTMGTITMTGFSVDADGDTQVKTLDASGLASLDGGVDVNGNMTVSTAGAIAGGTSYSGSTTIAAASLSVDGAVIAGSLSGSTSIRGASVGTDGTVHGGSLTDGTATISAGAASGFTTIDGSGDLTMGTITMTGFSVTAGGNTNVKTLDINSGGITDAGTIAGASTINASGLITGGSLTDGTALISAGGITGGTRYSGSHDIRGSFLAVDGAITGGSLSGSTVLGGNVTPYLTQQILDPQTDYALFNISSSLTTTYRVFWTTDCTDPAVTFTAPSSGKVMVDLNHYMDDTSTNGAGPYIYASLANSSATSLPTGSANIVTGVDRRIWSSDESDDAVHSYSFLVEGLIPDDSYTWYLFLRRTTSDDSNRVICGKQFPLFQMSVRSILETADIYNT